MNDTQYFDAKVRDIEFGESSGGTEQAEVKLDILNNGDVQMQRSVFLYFTPNAQKFSIEKLERIGFRGDTENFDWDRDKLIRLSMKMEEYNGEMREKWDIAKSRDVKPLAKDKGKRLNTLLRTSLGSVPAKASAPPRRSGPPPRKTAEAPPEGLSSITSYDEAYEWLSNLTPGESPDDDAFTRAIGEVEDDTGKVVEDFDSSDWSKFESKFLPM